MSWAEDQRKTGPKRFEGLFPPDWWQVDHDAYTAEDGDSTWAALHKRFGYPRLAEFGRMPAAEYQRLTYVLYREGVDAVVDAYVDYQMREMERAKADAEAKSKQAAGYR